MGGGGGFLPAPAAVLGGLGLQYKIVQKQAGVEFLHADEHYEALEILRRHLKATNKLCETAKRSPVGKWT